MDNKFKVSLLAASVFMAANFSVLAAEGSSVPAKQIAPRALSGILTGAQVTALGDVVPNGADATTKNKAQTLAETPAIPVDLTPEEKALLERYKNIEAEKVTAKALQNKAKAHSAAVQAFADASGSILFTGGSEFNSSTAFDTFTLTDKTASGTDEKDKNLAIASPLDLSTLAKGGALKNFEDKLTAFSDNSAVVYDAAKTAASDVKTTIEGSTDDATTLANAILNDAKLNVVTGGVKRWADKNAVISYITTATGAVDTAGVQAIGKALAYQQGTERWLSAANTVQTFQGDNIDKFIDIATKVSKGQTTGQLGELAKKVALYTKGLTEAKVEDWRNAISDPGNFKKVSEALKAILTEAKTAKDATGAEELKTFLDLTASIPFESAIGNLEKAATSIENNANSLKDLLTKVTDSELTAWKATMEKTDITAEEKKKATSDQLRNYFDTLIAIGKLSKTNAEALTTAIGDSSSGYLKAKAELDVAESELTRARAVFKTQYMDFLATKPAIVAANAAVAEADGFATTNADKKGIKEAKTLDAALGEVRTQVKTLSAGLFNIDDPVATGPSTLTNTGAGLEKTLRDAYHSEIAKLTTAPSDAEKQQLIIGTAKALAYGDSTTKTPLLTAVESAKNYYLNNALSDEKTSAALLTAITAPLATKDTETSGAQAAYDNAVQKYDAARTAYLELLTADALKWSVDITDLTSASDKTKPNNIEYLKSKLSAEDLIALEKAEMVLLQAASKAGDTAQTFAMLINGDDKSTLQTAKELNGKAGTQFATFTTLEAAKKSYIDSLNAVRNIGSMAGQAADTYSKLQLWNSDTEQKQAYDAYVALLSGNFSQTLGTVAEQKANASNSAKTLYLGGLSASDLATLDSNGDVRKLSVISGKNAASSLTFTQNDIYAGDKDNRIMTTALNIAAPSVTVATVAELADPAKHTLTVGGTDASNMLNVYTKTYDVTDSQRGTGTPVLSDRQKYVPKDSRDKFFGAAVVLNGNLRASNIDAEGNVPAGENKIAADKLVLQNSNIDNSVSLADLQKDGDLQRANVYGVLIENSTVQTVTDIADNPGSNPNYGTLVNKDLTTAPGVANIELNNVNIAVNNEGLTTESSAGANDGSIAVAIAITGNAKHLSVNGNGNNTITAIAAASDKAFAIGFGDGADFSSLNNTVDIKGVRITGGIVDQHGSVENGLIKGGALNTNTVNLESSVLTGDVQSNSTKDIALSKNFLALNLANTTWTGKSFNSPDISLNSGTTWNLTGNSSTNFLTLNGSNVINMVQNVGTNTNGDLTQSGVNNAYNLVVEQDLVTTTGSQTTVNIGTYNKDDVHLSSNYGFADDYGYGSITVDHLLTGDGKLALVLQNAGAEPTKDKTGTMLALPAALDGTAPHAFVTYVTREARGANEIVSSVADPFATSPLAELGVWQYQQRTVADTAANKTSVYFVSNGKLSNSAATVVSLASAPAHVAALELDALDKHISSLRHSESSGVWLSYYGGSNKNTLKSGPQYNLKTSGVMLGVDTSFADKWLAGVSFNSGKSTLSVLDSSGSVNNYGAQFWLSRHYDNGVFVNGNAQFGHYSNSAKVRMLDSSQARGEYATNGYGIGVKLGYVYQNAGFYAEPYAQATGRAFSGASYKLSNGMQVNSTDYKSFLGEIGTDIGYTVPTGAGYLKPYLHLAVLNEFATSNHVRANNIDLQNSINGTAFRIGIGGEVKLMQNLGGYASFDYTKGSNIERPWQANLGINYTW